MPTVWRGGYVTEDPDAAAYLDAVGVADGQSLEPDTRTAVNTFVEGCKSDGIWDAIKACCILAGARTLAGALVPLVGTAPDRFGTEGNWNYDRETGLQGDGSTNYLNSNRNNNADPQNNQHLSVYVSTAQTSGTVGPYIHSNGRITGSSGFGRSATNPGQIFARSQDINPTYTSGGASTGFIGISRESADEFDERDSSVSTTFTNLSETPPLNADIFVFAHDGSKTDARLSFYSIGEALDLALLDTRVSTLMTDLAAAIP